eukprot:scaffold118515_cov28-Tisochrysis_lutea.AAC.2
MHARHHATLVIPRPCSQHSCCRIGGSLGCFAIGRVKAAWLRRVKPNIDRGGLRRPAGDLIHINAYVSVLRPEHIKTTLGEKEH